MNVEPEDAFRKAALEYFSQFIRFEPAIEPSIPPWKRWDAGFSAGELRERESTMRTAATLHLTQFSHN